MADSKITALTALTAADPANDMIPIVDVSDTPPASGNTKRISINNLLACSPSATLASATITGDLTVDTSTLKVDSANDRVGIGTASPAAGAKLSVLGTTVVSASDFPNASTWSARFQAAANSQPSGIFLSGLASGGQVVPGSLHVEPVAASSRSALIATYSADSGVGYFAINRFSPSAGTTSQHFKIADDGVATWSNVGGVAGTAMTLNSTGLGIGGAPAGRLSLQTASGQTNLTLKSAGSTLGAIIGLQADGTAYFYQGDALPITFSTTGTERMQIDANGNLILSSSNTPATLATNGQLTVNATSNTNLRFSYRGSDGTTRVANITLA